MSIRETDNKPDKPVKCAVCLIIVNAIEKSQAEKGLSSVET